MIKTTKKIGNYFVSEGKKFIDWNWLNDNTQYMKKLADKAFNVPKKEDARVETFEQFRHRMNVSDSHLVRRYKELSITFYTFFIALNLSIYMMLYQASKGDYLTLLAGVGISALFSACCFKYSYRCWQIKMQTLGKIDKYLKDFNEWLPDFRLHLTSK